MRVAEPDFSVKIAVVGGGCAGAYSALRLQQAKRGPIGLFEYSDRIGGRLYTKTLPGMPHVHAEVGGMRYIPDAHLLVKGVIDNELGLRTRDFPMGSPPPVGAANNYMYLRQKHLLYSETSDSDKVPYNVRWSERNMSADQLQAWAYKYVVPGASNDTSIDDLFKVSFLGKKLLEYGLWDLLYLVLSSEAYAYMLDAGGYDTNVANGTAILNLPTTGDYAATTKYLTLVDGYDQMPIQAVEKFKSLGGQVHMNHRLESIVQRGKGVRLTFVITRTFEPEASILHSIEDTTDRVVVDAEHLILALPRRSIELIDWAPARDNKDLAAAINAVIIQAAFKLFLGYEYPWWRSLGLQAGRSITDNPIRQVYYFGTEQDAIGGQPGNTNSLMMASYNDLRSLPFWKAFENDPAFLGHDPMTGNAPGANVPRQTTPATTGMVDMAQMLVQEIHGMRSLPEPYTAAYHDWSLDPFGGGWHAWKAGIDFRKTMPYLRAPLPGWPVHVCGEAYSVQQGWVEGAYQTAELMLEEHFGLKRPSWLPKSYDLGP